MHVTKYCRKPLTMQNKFWKSCILVLDWPYLKYVMKGIEIRWKSNEYQPCCMPSNN